MPSRIHQADSDDRRASETVANGTPASFELTFEVGAPDLIGSDYNRGWFAWMREMTALSSFLDKPVTSE
jgi:hypothetical protein